MDTNESIFSALLQDEELSKEIASEELVSYTSRVLYNLERTISFVQAIRDLKSDEIKQDMMRMGVVFLHASFEDFLRTLMVQFLPYADEKTINEIPLLGLNDQGRPDSFKLGKLLQHREKSVNDLIKMSINKHLQRSNFSKSTEVAASLLDLGFEIEELKTFFPGIDQMMARRHMIVHRADFAQIDNTTETELNSIDKKEVIRWIKNIMNFIEKILPQVVTKYLQRSDRTGMKEV